eukprot:TRINITY_DN9498_c1_g1_i1.p2 TRINITY_DN9498_c1_g1~~TRINITY_DN9498_c1_g1_i1.p2  ORF type:complete len:594 (+),score=207.51 TRINITY_DN9498_c1_g1_i1:716-2497(+)
MRLCVSKTVPEQPSAARLCGCHRVVLAAGGTSYCAVSGAQLRGADARPAVAAGGGGVLLASPAPAQAAAAVRLTVVRRVPQQRLCLAEVRPPALCMWSDRSGALAGRLASRGEALIAVHGSALLSGGPTPAARRAAVVPCPPHLLLLPLADADAVALRRAPPERASGAVLAEVPTVAAEAARPPLHELEMAVRAGALLRCESPPERPPPPPPPQHPIFCGPDRQPPRLRRCGAVGPPQSPATPVRQGCAAAPSPERRRAGAKQAGRQQCGRQTPRRALWPPEEQAPGGRGRAAGRQQQQQQQQQQQRQGPEALRLQPRAGSTGVPPQRGGAEAWPARADQPPRPGPAHAVPWSPQTAGAAPGSAAAPPPGLRWSPQTAAGAAQRSAPPGLRWSPQAAAAAPWSADGGATPRWTAAAGSAPQQQHRQRPAGTAEPAAPEAGLHWGGQTAGAAPRSAHEQHCQRPAGSSLAAPHWGAAPRSAPEQRQSPAGSSLRSVPEPAWGAAPRSAAGLRTAAPPELPWAARGRVSGDGAVCGPTAAAAQPVASPPQPETAGGCPADAQTSAPQPAAVRRLDWGAGALGRVPRRRVRPVQMP